MGYDIFYFPTSKKLKKLPLEILAMIYQNSFLGWRFKDYLRATVLKHFAWYFICVLIIHQLYCVQNSIKKIKFSLPFWDIQSFLFKFWLCFVRHSFIGWYFLKISQGRSFEAFCLQFYVSDNHTSVILHIIFYQKIQIFTILLGHTKLPL